MFCVTKCIERGSDGHPLQLTVVWIFQACERNPYCVTNADPAAQEKNGRGMRCNFEYERERRSVENFHVSFIICHYLGAVQVLRHHLGGLEVGILTVKVNPANCEFF